MVGLLGLAPALAQGAIAGTTTVVFPSEVTVGQTGVPATITITNANSGGDTNTANTICATGDPGFCGGAGITLQPACSGLSGQDCFPGNEEPGVFASAPTASGRTGSACQDVSFAVSTDPVTGKLSLTQDETITLLESGFSCTIDLELSVVGGPGDDSNEQVGVQTEQIAKSTQLSGSQTAGSIGNSSTTVVGQPSIATAASPSIALGGTVTDTATVSERVIPIPGQGTVTFNLYGPDDATCQPPEAFTSTVPISDDGTATSAPFTPPQVGTYRWIASYSGDDNNNPVGGACGDAGEIVVVGPPVVNPPPPPPATPAIGVVASPGIVLGGQVSATATVGGRVNPVGNSSVLFRLFGPDDSACAGTPLFSATAPVSAQGVAGSPPFTPPSPLTGVYRWTATYTGDANNVPVSTACGAPGSVVTVSPLPAQILSAGFVTQPRVGVPAFLEVAAFDPTGPISGVQAQFGEPRGLSGISACRQPIAFGIADTPVRLRLPYTFLRPGRHTIRIIVLTGGCTGRVRRTVQTIEVVVAEGQSTRVAFAAGAVAAAAAGPAARAAQSGGCKNTFVRPTSKATSRLKVATAILCLVNVERRKKGLTSLKRSKFLAQAATGHSKDMLKRRFFEHVGPGGPSFPSRLKRIRYRGSSAAENIAYGSNFNAKLVLRAWMNSPPHKANILGPRSRFLGVGIAVGIPVTPGRPGSTYTQVFGSTLK